MVKTPTSPLHGLNVTLDDKRIKTQTGQIYSSFEAKDKTAIIPGNNSKGSLKKGK